MQESIVLTGLSLVTNVVGSGASELLMPLPVCYRTDHKPDVTVLCPRHKSPGSTTQISRQKTGPSHSAYVAYVFLLPQKGKKIHFYFSLLLNAIPDSQKWLCVETLLRPWGIIIIISHDVNGLSLLAEVDSF